MVISLPVSQTIKKEVSEKTFEIKLPSFAERVTENRFIAAFKIVLRSPVK